MNGTDIITIVVIITGCFLKFTHKIKKWSCLGCACTQKSKGSVSENDDDHVLTRVPKDPEKGGKNVYKYFQYDSKSRPTLWRSTSQK